MTETDMTRGRILPILVRFLIPLWIGNVFQQLYNMCDTIIVGRFVGENALAAVGSTGNIMFLIFGLTVGLTSGFTVLTSQYFGAGRPDQVRGSVANSILLSLIVTVVMTACFLLGMKPLLRLMNTPDDIFQDAYTYIMIISAGTCASVFYNLASSFLRAVGNSRVPLMMLVFSACLNVVLDLLLIIRFHMGVAGAAVATIFSQAVSAVLCFIYIWKKVEVLCPKKDDWHFHHSMSREQMKVGIPMSLQYAITASGTIVMQTAINQFGSTAVAGFTAGSKLSNLLTQEMISMGQAMATFAGQNFGSGQFDRIRKGVRDALLFNIGYSLFAAGLGVLILVPVVGLFFSGGTDLSAMLPYARTYCYLSYTFYIPLSFIFIFRNAMQGCGYGFLPMMGGVVEFVARFVTALISMHVSSYLLACACDPAAWVTTAIFQGIAYLAVMKDIKKKYTKAPETL